MLTFLLCEKVAQGVDVVPESLRQLAPHGTDFFDDRIFVIGVHGASSSSGVQTMGGSKPLAQHNSFTTLRTTPFAM